MQFYFFGGGEGFGLSEVGTCFHKFFYYFRQVVVQLMDWME